MTAQEIESNSEHAIINYGTYDTLRKARAYEDGQTFSIVPVRMPWLKIIFTNLIFALFFGGFYWFCDHYATDNRKLGMAVSIVLGVVVSILYTAYAVYTYRKENRLGPWLIIEKDSGRVILPRQDMAFESEQVVHLQFITGYTTNYYGDGGPTTTQKSELNLITFAEGERNRWPILKTLGTGSLGAISRKLVRATEAPLLRYKQGLRGGLEIKDMRTGEVIQRE